MRAYVWGKAGAEERDSQVIQGLGSEAVRGAGETCGRRLYMCYSGQGSRLDRTSETAEINGSTTYQGAVLNKAKKRPRDQDRGAIKEGLGERMKSGAPQAGVGSAGESAGGWLAAAELGVRERPEAFSGTAVLKGGTGGREGYLKMREWGDPEPRWPR